MTRHDVDSSIICLVSNTLNFPPLNCPKKKKETEIKNEVSENPRSENILIPIINKTGICIEKIHCAENF